MAETRRMSVQSLSQELKHDGLRVLDVRRKPEWDNGHIEGARWWPLDNFHALLTPSHSTLPPIPKSAPLAVHCKSGYRSMIACSLLQRMGFENVTDVTGGFDAWQQAGLPVATDVPVEDRA